MSTLLPGSPVNHPVFGRGVVEYSKGETTLVRFSRGIEECLTGELTFLRSGADAYLQGQPAPAAPVVRVPSARVRDLGMGGDRG